VVGVSKFAQQVIHSCKNAHKKTVSLILKLTAFILGLFVQPLEIIL
jgi:hypothetical protein